MRCVAVIESALPRSFNFLCARIVGNAGGNRGLVVFRGFGVSLINLVLQTIAYRLKHEWIDEQWQGENMETQEEGVDV